MTRTFRCVNEHSWIGGVCGGIAYWLGVPTWIVRVLAVVAVFGYGASLWPYLLLWWFAPEWETDPADYTAVTGDD